MTTAWNGHLTKVRAMYLASMETLTEALSYVSERSGIPQDCLDIQFHYRIRKPWELHLYLPSGYVHHIEAQTLDKLVEGAKEYARGRA